MTPSTDSPVGLSRRDFIRLGTAGTVIVATGAGLSTLTGCSRSQPPAEGFHRLRQQDVDLLKPLVPVLLAGALPNNHDQTHLKALLEMDSLLDQTDHGAYAEIVQLYDALQFAPIRRYLTGHWGHFGKLSDARLRQALDNWRSHSRGFGRLTLRAVSQPLLMAWYLTPEGAASTGYPGPPKKVIS